MVGVAIFFQLPLEASRNSTQNCQCQIEFMAVQEMHGFHGLLEALVLWGVLLSLVLKERHVVDKQPYRGRVIC